MHLSLCSMLYLSALCRRAPKRQGGNRAQCADLYLFRCADRHICRSAVLFGYCSVCHYAGDISVWSWIHVCCGGDGYSCCHGDGSSGFDNLLFHGYCSAIEAGKMVEAYAGIRGSAHVVAGGTIHLQRAWGPAGKGSSGAYDFNFLSGYRNF